MSAEVLVCSEVETLGHVQRLLIAVERRHATQFCEIPLRELQLKLPRRLVHLRLVLVLLGVSARLLSVV